MGITISVTLTDKERSLARQLGITERDALKAKERNERERVQAAIARAKAKEAVQLTPMEIELGQALGIDTADLLRAKTGPKSTLPEEWIREGDDSPTLAATELAIAQSIGLTEADLAKWKNWRFSSE